jgi:hypothetical protein
VRNDPLRSFCVLGLLALLAAAPAAAQSSTSYKLTETSFNNAGDPVNGATLGSAHYHIKLDTIGAGTGVMSLTSGSFHLDTGFAGVNRPPGEVTGVRFTNPTTLQWNAEPSAEWYEVYQATSLPGTFGTCYAGDLTTASLIDASTPPLGSRVYYMVTVRNRLREEGTKGFGSTGTERTNTLPCP